MNRCSWCGALPDYIAYHDTEWGFPVSDDRRLFEKICLEGFQSGLSWLTIFRKRPAFREAFAGFDFTWLQRFNNTDVKRLLLNEGIVRHRGKIEAVLHNACRACELVNEHGSLAAYFWSFEPSAESAKSQHHVLSKDLKKRGWKFVGPTTVYAFMQAMGLVNDHAEDCFVREHVTAARRDFIKPVNYL